MLSIFALLLPMAICRATGELPDSACTPGAVATADMHVICTTSTKSRRHVDDAMKRRVLASYGVPWDTRNEYEVDHLVPIEVGGSNDQTNLWPQPLAEARRKDVVEDESHRLVCAGKLRVEDAQARFAADWRTVLQ